jgi:anti-anti-sigma factor
MWELQMEIRIAHENSNVPVTVIQLHGDVDGSNYRRVIDAARQLCSKGTRDVLVDLREVPFMSSAGLVALHSIALMVRGESPSEGEHSWGALHAIDRDRERGVQVHLKLVGPQPRVSRVLEMAGFNRFIEVHPDLETALASF